MALHQFLPESAGGTEQHVFQLSRSLMRAGHQVHLFYARTVSDAEESAQSTGSYSGIPWTAVHRDGRNLVYRSTYRCLRAEAVFQNLLKAFQPDILHVHHLQGLSSELPGMAQAAHVPVLCTLHDYYFECLAGGQRLLGSHRLCKTPSLYHCTDCLLYSPYVDRGRSAFRPMRTFLWRVQNRLIQAFSTRPLRSIALRRVDERQRSMIAALRDVDLFIAPSRFISSEFQKYGVDAERIFYLPHAVEPGAAAARELHAESLRFGFIGSIIPQKGLHLLLEAFRELHSRRKITLSIHGGFGGFKTYNARIRKMVRETPNAVLKGAFNHEQIEDILHGFDVLVVPSIWYENAPLVILEALAAQVAVVTADSGGMKEWIERTDKGWLFKRNHAQSLRHCLQYLIDHPEAVEAAAARPFTAQSPDAYAVEMTDIYQRLREKRPLMDPAVPAPGL